MTDPRQQALAEQAVKTISDAERRIWVTFQQEGLHRYPAAASNPNLATGDQYDVSFLSYPHRHMFHFRVWISVLHSDRELEFIQFKRWLCSLYAGQGSVLDLNDRSCEMIADELYIQIIGRYPGRSVWIEVSEDGENGCLIKYEQPKSNLTLGL